MGMVAVAGDHAIPEAHLMCGEPEGDGGLDHCPEICPEVGDTRGDVGRGLRGSVFPHGVCFPLGAFDCQTRAAVLGVVPQGGEELGWGDSGGQEGGSAS